MQNQISRARTRLGAIVAGLALIGGTMISAGPAHADTAPSDVSQPQTAGTTSLPTVQVDGVVWSQVIVGNTVYVGGDFTTAYPAGATKAAGVARKNLLAYDITTGNLIESWNPGSDAKVRAVAVSPDGKTVYVGGNFTQVAGQPRSRVAAFDATTGALTTWAPKLNAAVYAVSATNTAVYVGGAFTNVNNIARNKIAGISSTGSVLAYNPNISGGSVNAIAVKPDGNIIVAGGTFTAVGGVPVGSLAATSAATGALVTWAVGDTISYSGKSAGIMSLAADASGVYAAGFNADLGANPRGLEGVVKIGWDGNISWLSDCHGDSYSVAPAGDVVYVASHAHTCANIPGGDVLPQTSPWSYLRGTALQNTVAGANNYQNDGYPSFKGVAAPRLLQFFPDLAVGTFTGATQAAWSVATNGKYVLFGGEFPKVNGKAQAGLARFALPSVQKSTDGPRLSGATMNPTLTPAANSVTANFTANWDRDNKTLTYALYRRGVTAPVATTTLDSAQLLRPRGELVDSGVQPNSAYEYRIVTIDPDGNKTTSDWVAVTTPAAAPEQPAEPAQPAQPAPQPVTNLALGTPATQSSTYVAQGSANKAVDGNTAGTWGTGTLTHTNNNLNAWWQTDLGAAKQISSINLFNRTDAVQDRLSDYWVFVSNTPFNTSLTPAQQAAQPGVWSQHLTQRAGSPTQIPVGAQGRYVMVQLNGQNYLTIAELQVMGR